MNFVNKIEISIDGKSLKSFSSLSLQQNIFGHHSLEVVFQRDTFEKEGNLILDESDKLLRARCSDHEQLYPRWIDLHPLSRWHQPQPQRIHQMGTCRKRRKRAAAYDP